MDGSVDDFIEGGGMKPHKHAELIHAWADGAEIQVKNIDGLWVNAETPYWNGEPGQYRIKPADKVVRWKWAYNVEGDNGVWREYSLFLSEEEVKEYFNEIKHMKLEYTRTEFPE